MAQGNKSWLRRTALQTAAVFILLSVSGECLQCYWCGPRAEQVHRKERAPSCNEAAVTNQETACDPGYTHCAIVVTAPPYAESRHCVKFYQDECYAQYCNSTKSFRMTCPCRGDLCNGPKTDREIAAIDAFTKFVASNTRAKRNAITSNNFISAGKEKMNNLIENEDQEENPDANETINETKDDREENGDTNDTINETNDSVTQTERPTEEPAGKTPNSNTVNDIEVNTTPEAQANLVKTVESTTEAIKEMPVAMEVISTAESLKIELTTTKIPETSMKPAETLNVEVSELLSNDIKPSMQGPTAEALQQNASPVVTTEKSMEQTTVPTMTTTPTHDDGTPTPTESKNNSAVATLSTFILICSLALNASS